MLTKICGIKDKIALRATVAHKASFMGLNFYPLSPRYLNVAEAQSLLRFEQLGATQIVALTVNANAMVLGSIVDSVKPNVLQLHGDESPILCQEIRQAYNLPVIKAISIRQKSDLELAESYYGQVDYLLLDAPVPEGSQEYGGTGRTVDWRLLRNWDCPVPWLLAGGLNTANVCEAIQSTNPYGVDVSSGVEYEKGQKDPEQIKLFLEKVQACEKL